MLLGVFVVKMVMGSPSNGCVLGQGGFRLVPILGILLMVQKSSVHPLIWRTYHLSIGVYTSQVVLVGGLGWLVGWLVFSRLLRTFPQVFNIP